MIQNLQISTSRSENKLRTVPNSWALGRLSGKIGSLFQAFLNKLRPQQDTSFRYSTYHVTTRSYTVDECEDISERSIPVSDPTHVRPTCLLGAIPQPCAKKCDSNAPVIGEQMRSLPAGWVTELDCLLSTVEPLFKTFPSGAFQSVTQHTRGLLASWGPYLDLAWRSVIVTLLGNGDLHLVVIAGSNSTVHNARSR